MISKKTETTIWCDMGTCWVKLVWPVSLTREKTEQRAKVQGWRRDKLGRHVCPAHPKLKGARR